MQMSSFICKRSAFFGQNSTFTQSKSVKAVLKVTINENVSFTDYASGIRLPDCSKLAINWKNGNDITIFRHEVIVKSFCRCFVSLLNFSYWSKFHVNITTSSGAMTISFYKGLTRNPEMGNTPLWILLNIWRQGQVRNNKLGTNVSNKMLLNDTKCHGCSFYHFWVRVNDIAISTNINNKWK